MALRPPRPPRPPPPPRPPRKPPPPSRDDRVPLHAVAVHREDISTLLVEKGVEVDRDGVVAEAGPVPVDAVGPHDSRVLVPGVEGEVDVRVVIRDVDGGAFGGGGSVERSLLDEVGDLCGVLPHGVVESSVDVWSRPGSDGAHGDANRPEHRRLH